MAQKLGTIIGVAELKARWAYAEINSSRFGGLYIPHVPPHIAEAARLGVPFNELEEQDWPTLAAILGQVRGPGLVDQLDQYGENGFECAHWDATKLLNSVTLPCFGQVQYYRFLAMPGKATKAHDTDPRLASAAIPFDESFCVEEPVIALQERDYARLLEGYLRSILWLRNPSAPLPVWVPKV